MEKKGRKGALLGQIFHEKERVLSLWKGVLEKGAEDGIKRLVFCLPAWKKPDSDDFWGFSEEMERLGAKKGFTKGFLSQDLLRYAREDALVARDLIFLEKK